MAAAVGLGRLEADLVAVEARRHLEASRATPGPAPLEAVGAQSVQQHRPPPTLGEYDALLAPLGASA